VLLFLLLQWATSSDRVCWCALFALHRSNVEWCLGGERKNVLSTLFFSCDRRLCVVCQKPDCGDILLVSLFAVGLWPSRCHPLFLLLLLDYWPLEQRRSTKPRAERPPQRPTAVGSQVAVGESATAVSFGCSAWITLIAQRSAVRTLEEFSFASRIENALSRMALPMENARPAKLALYPHSVTSSSMAMGSFGAGPDKVTALLSFFAARDICRLLVLVLGTLIPVLGLVQWESSHGRPLCLRAADWNLVMIAFGLAI